MPDAMPPVLRVPGKLMLAGEYAVLRADGLALSTAVGELVSARVVDGPPGVELTAFGHTWHLPGAREGLAGFAQLALDWLAAHGAEPRLRWQVEVAGGAGQRKLGLGTSAAVTVAVLSAGLRAAGLPSSAGVVAAAAREVHGQAQVPAGSGYDVSSIAHGGVVAYWREARDGQGEGGPRVQRLTWPSGLWAAALYSGEPASTAAALRRVPAAAHLDRIGAAARELLSAWPEGAPAVLAALRHCQHAFDGARADDPGLGSAGIAAVRATVEAAGCVARTSGAGGGDCLLAFATDPERLQHAVDAWLAQGGLLAATLPGDLAAETT
jgi:phosphomevalonate kinase